MLDNELTGNVSEDARKRLEAHKERLQRLKEALSWLMADKRGRLLMHELLVVSGIYRTTFIESPERSRYMAEAMAFEEGRKQLGYKALQKITRECPKEYLAMLKENSQ